MENKKIALCLSGKPTSSMFCFAYIYDAFLNNNYNVDSEIMYEKMLSHFLAYKKHFITHNELINFIKTQKAIQKTLKFLRIVQSFFKKLGQTTIL